MDKRGFTLIELLVVIAIIGILAGVAVTSYIGSTKKAARTEAYTNLESLRLLEEDFFSLNATYTGNLGVAGNTVAIRDANLTAIQGSLPGFQPGDSSMFCYRIVANEDIDGNPLTPCFRAIATGLAGSRVDGDVFAIDCNNNRNF